MSLSGYAHRPHSYRCEDLGKEAISHFVLLRQRDIAVAAVTKELLLSTSRSYDVSAKQQFDNVVIALTLGRGTVLFDRNARHIIVIRESDITKIVPHGK